MLKLIFAAVLSFTVCQCKTENGSEMMNTNNDVSGEKSFEGEFQALPNEGTGKTVYTLKDTESNDYFIVPANGDVAKSLEKIVQSSRVLVIGTVSHDEITIKASSIVLRDSK
ncbi:MAG: hypothetical protein AB7T49_16975 [Oligoflexales bacterium]